MSETILDSVADSPDDVDSEDEGCVQSSTRVMTIALAVVVVVVIVFCFARAGAGAPQTLESKLVDCGWVLYTRKGCGPCRRQLDALGGDFAQRVDCNVGGTLLSSNCDQAPFTCSEVPAYPYWYNLKTKEIRTGVQPYNSLITMASA